MEMADGIAINKCDGNNIERAHAARVSFKNALMLFPPSESGWKPEAICCSSIDHTGVMDVWENIEQYIAFTKKNGYFDAHRTEQAKYCIGASGAFSCGFSTFLIFWRCV